MRDGGATQLGRHFKYESVDPLIVRVGWTPDGKKVVYEIQNREQTWLDLNYADPASGKSADAACAKPSKAWVDVDSVEEPQWLERRIVSSDSASEPAGSTCIITRQTAN